MADSARQLTYEDRQRYACKVCQNYPDEDGELEHGKGCFVLSEDGGGSEWIEFESVDPVCKRQDDAKT